jgi:hypothetical protein
MREVIPAYQPGDQVELHNELFEVSWGYCLKGKKEKLFVPKDMAGLLRPVVH